MAPFIRFDIGSDKAIEENFDYHRNEMKPAVHWRVTVSNWISLAAFACLIAGLLGVGALFWYAYNRGLYPNPNAPHIYTGGQWSHDNELRNARQVDVVLDPFIYAFLLAATSLLLKLNWRSGLISVSSLFLLFIFFIQLLGLGED